MLDRPSIALAEHSLRELSQVALRTQRTLKGLNQEEVDVRIACHDMAQVITRVTEALNTLCPPGWEIQRNPRPIPEAEPTTKSL